MNAQNQTPAPASDDTRAGHKFAAVGFSLVIAAVVAYIVIDIWLLMNGSGKEVEAEAETVSETRP